jgi:hypothetical protein
MGPKRFYKRGKFLAATGIYLFFVLIVPHFVFLSLQHTTQTSMPSRGNFFLLFAGFPKESLSYRGVG